MTEVAKPAADAPEKKNVTVKDAEDESDDEPPALESGEEGTPADAGAGVKPMSRGEKKSRKAISKLGLKQVPGVTRVTFKQSAKGQGSSIFVVAQPDVYKSPNADTYVVFGEATMDNQGAMAQTAAADKYKMPETDAVVAPKAGDAAPAAATEAAAPAADAAAPAAATDGSDESGLEPKDIELVMTQAGVEREKAVAALQKNKGDIVNAIMDLTM